MLSIARQQIAEGLLDAKYVFLAALVLALFAANGFIYSQRIVLERASWQESVNENTEQLSRVSASLRDLSQELQRVVKPTSSLVFIADDGATPLPNALMASAFFVQSLSNQTRRNERIASGMPIDWAFIIGTMMTLVTVLIGYDAICGEKRRGTLRLLLANPISRIRLFAGKYLGLISLLVIMLGFGCLLSVTILVVSGALPVEADVLLVIAGALVISVLCLSLFLLLSMLVSSMTARPAVSLVSLLICWVIVVIALPGLLRIISEPMVEVPSRSEFIDELRRAYEEVWNQAPDATLDPNNVAIRAEWFRRDNDERMHVLSAQFSSMAQQFHTVQNITSIAPPVLFSNALQQMCNTGVYGFDNLTAYTMRYKRLLSDYIIAEDAKDPESMHEVYYRPWHGTFSARPVELSTVPRWHSMWSSGGLPALVQLPLFHAMVLLLANLQIAFIALFTISRYDPR